MKESENYYYLYFIHSAVLITLSAFIFFIKDKKYEVLDPILSLIIIGLILLKNLNVPGFTFNLMILKENEAVLIKEIKEDIKDKVLEIYEIDEMRLIPMSSVVADFESI